MCSEVDERLVLYHAYSLRRQGVLIELMSCKGLVLLTVSVLVKAKFHMTKLGCTRGKVGPG